jgi:hypothetical protein
MQARQALYHLSHATNPFFALAIFEIGSHFMPRPSLTVIFLFVLPCTAGMTGVHHSIKPLVEMGSYNLFCPGWP